MPTYAENAAAREREVRKRAEDSFLRSQADYFDLAATDNRMKYERPSFIVVTASEKYRKGWDEIFGALELQARPDPTRPDKVDTPQSAGV